MTGYNMRRKYVCEQMLLHPLHSNFNERGQDFSLNVGKRFANDFFKK